jgi:radical SAM protein with 4Fe4S-binding SPASM domain
VPYLRVIKTPFVRRTPVGRYIGLPHFYGLERLSSMIEIDESAEELLKLCDGTRTRDDILRQLSEASGEPIKEFASDFDEFVEYLVGEGVLEWREEPSFIEPLYDGNKPFSMSIEITSACDLQCGFCMVNAGVARVDDLTLDDVAPLIEQIKRMKPTPISITGGEPLLKKKMLLHIIEELTPIKEIDLNVFTNGTLITKDYAQQLYDAGLRIARVSIDGHTAQLHDAIRGKKGAFEKTVQGVHFLRDLGIHVHVVSVISRMNYQYMEEIREFAGQVSDSCNTPFVYPVGRAAESDFLLSPEEILAVKTSDLGSDEIHVSINAREGCYVAKAINVAANGDVFPCYMLRAPEFKIGNIRENDLSEIYKTEKVQSFLKLTVDGIEHCRGCDIRYLCGGGCRGFAFMLNGSAYGPDTTTCEANKSLAQKILMKGDKETKEALQELMKSTRALNG